MAKIIQTNLVTIYDTLTEGVKFAWHDECGTRSGDYVRAYRDLVGCGYYDEFEKQEPFFAHLIKNACLGREELFIR